MTSRLGSVGQRCSPVSGEGSGQGGMLISDSHYCRAVTTSTSRIHPSPIRVAPHGKQGAHTVGVGLSIIPSTGGLRWISPLTTRTVRWVYSIPDSTWEEKEVEDSRRRSRRDDGTGKEVGIEDKSQVEKEMSPCPDERQSIDNNLPWSPLTTRGNHGGAYSSPGPTRGLYLNL
ncbi:hypothetical protein PoB_006061500 [Plakobranchus ocellatus]|uniref:Uncharacterized protein n=1 Tax=Plakobranchus ocellatus TaxID=259542 RepID=A0AAV4CQD5_9GAST|nr:hypothetical protein PoB_006061500 [Plakobranchus ocellatus]